VAEGGREDRAAVLVAGQGRRAQTGLAGGWELEADIPRFLGIAW
jgi:hypothetical protein